MNESNREGFAGTVVVLILLMPPALGAEPVPPVADADAELAAMTLTLTNTQPPMFVLSFSGQPRAFTGLICYWFAGYNETCMDPKLEWLTPATEIALHAPGGVPRDLLRGYVLLARYPSMSEATFRYELVSVKRGESPHLPAD